MATDLKLVRYLESYTPDDNRYDLRPFLYPRFVFEHRKIENMLKKVREIVEPQAGADDKIKAKL